MTALLGLVLGLVLSGCTDPGTQQDARPGGQEGGPTTGPATGPTAELSKVLVVIEENHSLDEMRAEMPYAASLAERYGYATHWSSATHPSEPNYLAMAGGSTFGVTDDRSPAANAPKVGGATSVFGQALAAGRTARTYAESMPENCAVYDHPDESEGDPVYAVRHNPWVYFATERSDCLENDVDTSGFAADAGADRLPDFGFLVPDLRHDAHDGSLAEADAWLQEQLAPVLASEDFTSGRLAVVLTADEDDRTQDNTVLTAVFHPRLHHRVVDTPLTVFSLPRFIAEVLDVGPLAGSGDAPDLRAAFGL